MFMLWGIIQEYLVIQINFILLHYTWMWLQDSLANWMIEFKAHKIYDQKRCLEIMEEQENLGSGQYDSHNVVWLKLRVLFNIYEIHKTEEEKKKERGLINPYITFLCSDSKAFNDRWANEILPFNGNADRYIDWFMNAQNTSSYLELIVFLKKKAYGENHHLYVYPTEELLSEYLEDTESIF